MQISLARPNQYLTCRNISHHRDKCDTLKALFDVQFGLYKYRCAVMSLSDKKFSISFCWFPRLCFHFDFSAKRLSEGFRRCQDWSARRYQLNGFRAHKVSLCGNRLRNVVERANRTRAPSVIIDFPFIVARLPQPWTDICRELTKQWQLITGGRQSSGFVFIQKVILWPRVIA